MIGVTNKKAAAWDAVVMIGEGRVDLQIFVEPECDRCERARRLAEEVDCAYPALAVRVTDLAEKASRRDDVFAVPTYVLNGEVFSLGNPLPQRLRREIERLLNQSHSL